MKKAITITAISMAIAANLNLAKPAQCASKNNQMELLGKKVESVESLPFKIFWVKTKDGASYIATSNGRFVIESPKLLDVQTGKTVTTIEELREAMKPDVNKYATLWLVKKGKPSALIVVDEYCPYCERLVKDILTVLQTGKTPKYDLAVTFFPIHRQSVEATCKLMSIGQKKARETFIKWVQTHDSSVWNNIKCVPEMQKKFFVKAAQLNTMVGISATPTVILPDGKKIIGYRNPEEFLF